MIRTLASRIRAAFADLSRSDGDTRPGPGAVACTALGHYTLAAWTCMGLLMWTHDGVFSFLATLVLWSVWEVVQYLRTPGVRVLRDWLLGNGPSYAGGAGVATAIAVSGGAIEVWLWSSALAGAHILIQAAVFGRVPSDAG